ncbi:MAG: spermidine/putrescine ABC transporter substrate-binding protein, partial [Eubacteriales bacterium]
CIPKGCENKEGAEAFINFLCETEVAVANCEYISYFTPQIEAAEILGIDERIYPNDEVLANSETFIMLGDEANAHMEDLWLKIRSTSAFDNPLYILILIILLAIVIFAILYVVRKRKKAKIDY